MNVHRLLALMDRHAALCNVLAGLCALIVLALEVPT